MHNYSRLISYFVVGMILGFLGGALWVVAEKANRINDSFKEAVIKEATSKKACNKPQESCL